MKYANYSPEHPLAMQLQHWATSFDFPDDSIHNLLNLALGQPLLWQEIELHPAYQFMTQSRVFDTLSMVLPDGKNGGILPIFVLYGDTNFFVYGNNVILITMTTGKESHYLQYWAEIDVEMLKPVLLSKISVPALLYQ